ncbi:MAG: hypothetical protein D6737_15140 [Chloroflexi bacterium]|nr:MAG: hypothetical protein D6737_15140 [Chloroflexota bacterium]
MPTVFLCESKKIINHKGAKNAKKSKKIIQRRKTKAQRILATLKRCLQPPVPPCDIGHEDTTCCAPIHFCIGRKT